MKARRGFWITIAVLLIATAIYYPFSPGGRQRRNMNLAERHIQTLKPILAADARFDKIELMTSTADLGSLLVVGEIASPNVADELRAIILQSNPPTAVTFNLYRAAGTQPASQRERQVEVPPLP